jgi:hypothetical protein
MGGADIPVCHEAGKNACPTVHGGDIMQSRFLIRIAAVLATIIAGGTQAALAGDRDNLIPLTVAGSIAELTAQGGGHLSALSARQQLRDEVCIALADGRITHFERSLILSHARRILKPEEYAQFRASLDPLAPPMPEAAPRPPKIAWSKVLIGPPTTVRRRSPSAPSAEVMVTDHMASGRMMR